MSSISAPFGLRPAFHPSGLDRAQAVLNGIASGYASNILKGQPVSYGTGGTSNGTIVLAGTTGAWSGAFDGVEYTDSTGRHRVSNCWLAGTTYLSDNTMRAYFYNDQNIVYEIQADGPMAQTTVGNEFDFTNIAAGSTVTGLSQATLGASTAVGSGNQGQMRVVDLGQGVDNAWGDAYTVVRVVNSQSQFFGSVTAIA
jgi:hypothetical protein